MSDRKPQLRKKKRVRQARDAPFPVPIATVTNENVGDQNWFYYTGELDGNHVTVKYTGDMNFLYKMGFFGKGTLSRSCPDYDQRCRRVHVPQEFDSTIQLKVISRRKFVRHRNWRQSCDPDLASEEEEKEIGSDVSEECDEDNTNSALVETDKSSLFYRRTIVQNQSHDEPLDLMAGDWSKSEQSELSKAAELWEDKTSMKMEQNNQSSASWDTADPDINFWTSCEDANKNSTSSWDNSACDVDFWTSNDMEENKNKSSVLDSPETFEDKNGKMLSVVERTETKGTEEICDSGVVLTIHSSDNNMASSKLSTERRDKSPDKKDHNTCDRSSLPCSSELDKIETGDTVLTGDCNTGEDKNKKQVISEFKSQEHSVEIQRPQTGDKAGEISDVSDTELDPLCKESESEGDVLVIDDSDEDGEPKRKRKRGVWQAVMKRDLCPVKEELRLTHEETFFLSYGLGCLTVLDENKVPLSLADMWLRFTKGDKRFLPKYIAYHYFRSKGWVPKSGLKFGADFILYRVGPAFFHGSYSVVVRMVHEGSLAEVEEFSDRRLTWTSLSGLNRATEHVAKELMFCYVVMPTDMTSVEMLSPKCVPRFKVQEQVLHRWVSSQEREKDKEREEIP